MKIEKKLCVFCEDPGELVQDSNGDFWHESCFKEIYEKKEVKKK